MFDDPESSLAFYVYTTLYNSQNLIAFTQIITIHKERVELEERFPTNVRKYQLDRVIARFDFETKGAGELSLHRGDVIEVINRNDENWWRGRTSDGRCGLFPSNFVDDLPSVI
ncbi:unnamed protein product [Schistosoma curassoni]|uniref:SH3 domain-containing protein n=1 Tax=Schistosoma curassoni TaxID=6186 RepID=A0A183K9Q8_9TREM|nr:unnamed protein product [Schistosoma curassoni]